MRLSSDLVLFSIYITLIFVVMNSSIKLLYFICISLYFENSTCHYISDYFLVYYNHRIVQMLKSQIKYTYLSKTMWLKTINPLLFIVFAISLLLIGITIDNVIAEVSLSNMINLDQDSNLSTMINIALLGNMESIPSDTPILSEGGEEYQVIHSHQISHSQLSIMINNSLLGNMESIPSDTSGIYNVQEQFITIKPDGYNGNIIFEEPKKKVDLLNSNVPFLLPVPFP